MIDQTPQDLNKTETTAETSQGRFLDYGVGQVAYVRPIKEESAVGYGIYAANGAQIAIATDTASAYGFLMQHDLMPISLH